MTRLFLRCAAIALAAGALLTAGVAVRADEGKYVIIENSHLFQIRNGDTLNGVQMSVQDRIDHIQDLFAKYLGGQTGKFTTKKYGERTHIYMNGEFVLAVTPADARSSGYKTTDKLAPIWVKHLAKGFAEGHTKQGP